MSSAGSSLRGLFHKEDQWNHEQAAHPEYPEIIDVRKNVGLPEYSVVQQPVRLL